MGTDLRAKSIVLTGATSGIGLAAVEILAGQGANIIGVGRSPERCRQTEECLRAAYPQSQIDYLVADLALQSQVRSLAAQVGGLLSARGESSLYALVNNAGTFTYWLTLTPEGFEMQWIVNYLAPFLLTLELLPLLQAAPQGRVVTVSSESHYRTRLKWDDLQLRRHYNGLMAYKQTKLAGVLFTAELNRRLGPTSNLRAFAADPGLVKTDIGLKGTPAIVKRIWEWRRSAGISAAESARGITFLVGEPTIQNSRDIYWKHGVAKAPSRNALDEEAGRRLWAISEQMCGINQT